jgi:hypothetical protein
MTRATIIAGHVEKSFLKNATNRAPRNTVRASDRYSADEKRDAKRRQKAKTGAKKQTPNGNTSPFFLFDRQGYSL